MKKSILFILLSTLCSSFIELYSQEPCRVLIPEISEKYQGKCKKGFAHGRGVAEGIDKYEGQFKDGLPHGKGKYTWATGEVYDGFWIKGKKNGEGKLYYKKNGADSVKIGIWGDDIFVKRIKPAPFKVLKSISVSRYTIQRIREGNRVMYSFVQNGNPNRTITNLLFAPSSGSTYEISLKQGFDNVKFPFICKVNYTTLNSLRQSSFDVVFEVEIYDEGSWEITLFN